MSTLAERLKSTAPCGALTADELDAVLLWLSGRSHDAHPELAAALGPVEDQPKLRWRVFQHLDGVLLPNTPQGQLNTHAAHVHRGLAEATRRTRFRRLAAAFHTDRYSDPELIEWLTPRAQAIGLAYTAFRQGDKPLDVGAPTLANIDDWLKDIDGRSSAELRPRNTPTWLRRLSRVHNLHIKVPAALALVVLAPLFVLLLLSPNQSQMDSGIELVSELVSELDMEQAPPITRPMAEPAIEVAALAEIESPIAPERTPEPESEFEPEPALELDTELALAVAPPAEIPAAETAPAEVPSVDEPHAVEPGETLFAIAQQHNITWQADERSEPDSELVASVPSAPEPEIELAPGTELSPEPEPTLLAEAVQADPLTVLERAHAAIEAAELPSFLATLSDAPRENQQRGQDWFRVSYGTLFQSSTRRQIAFRPISVSGQAPRWQVMGQLQLTVDFSDQEPVSVSRITRYVLIEDDGGDLRIASIDY